LTWAERERYLQQGVMGYQPRRTLVTAAALAATTSLAHADLRSFTHTYEYTTVPEGRTAFELWHTQTRASSDTKLPQVYEGILDIEHGITEHWDVSFYQVFGQTADRLSSEPLHLSQAKLDTRYRLAERGEWPVDTVLYFAASKTFGDSFYELQGRVIGARDFGDITVAANAIVEIELGADAETELEVGWAAGATYMAHSKLRVGVETWGMAEDGEVYAAAGPALNWAPTGDLWATLTVGLGLTDEAKGSEFGFVSARAIIGILL
jgi:hypothetical protein